MTPAPDKKPRLTVVESPRATIAVTRPWLIDYLSRHILFVKKEYRADCPSWLPNVLFAKAYEIKIPWTDDAALRKAVAL